MVGVTISLSNQENEQIRVIEIKPIKTLNQPQSNQQRADDKEVNRLEEQIRRYQEEIAMLEQQREQLLSATKQEITEAKENWEEEKKLLIQQAHEQGYQDGFQQGQQEGLHQYEALINEVNGLMKQAKSDYYKTIEESEEKIIDLAMHTAARIIEQQITEDRETFIPIVASAIKEIKDQDHIAIYLHPNHYEFVVQQKDALKKIVDGDTQLSIFMDPALNENDCIIEYPFGQIDASVDTQLLQIRKALQEFVLENRQ